ncbi:hypothetical protein KY331_06470 [Candidatus Woesearchaeota archaeon]|nr:hypothetical protein [Candidatus Woesearchaeota archaeon]
MKFCKRASLNLSINAIVIIVLAMTMLGLGLGFIRGQFKQITKTTITVQKQVEEQIMEDLRTGNKKLSFPSTDVSLDRGSTATFALGVKNTQGVGALVFTINISATEARGEGDPSQISFFYDAGSYELGPADSQVYPFQVTDNANVVDTYKVKIVVHRQDGSMYDQKTFFLTVA